MKKTIKLILLGSVWAFFIGVGLVKLYDYEMKAGTTDFVTSHWPKGSNISKGHKGYQLVMVAHPHCPCTRASLSELELLMAQTNGNLDVHLLLVKPGQFSQEWAETGLFKNAQAVGNINVVVDEDGKQARLFGGTTSGQTFLFDNKGNLIFAGGITATRGHAGDNAGRKAIVDLVKRGEANMNRTPFFGCLLHDQSLKSGDNSHEL